MDKSLLDRLKALGLERGMEKIKPQPRHESFPIEAVMAGEQIETVYGNTFCVSEQFPVDFQYGRINFNDQVDYHVLSEWSGRIAADPPELERIVFLDTETSGLAGGTGTFAFLIGLGFWAEEGFRLMQIFLKEPADEPALLAFLDQLLTRFETVVTYNGKTFDIPLLNARHVLNAFQPPFSGFHHIDLLAFARRIWKNRLPSRSLGTVENEILGVTRGQEEIPGWMVPDIYFEYLKTGDARPLSGVFYHNRMDILSLAGLFKFGARLLHAPLSHIAEEGLDLIAVARLYEELGIISEALQLYEHSLSLGLPRPFFIQTIYRYAHIAKKQGDWERAVYLWEKAAYQDEIDACIEIAKYHEHVNRDMDNALNWTIRAFDILQRASLPQYAHLQYARMLERRKDRILRKKNTGQHP
jgi:hypothetical protein